MNESDRQFLLSQGINPDEAELVQQPVGEQQNPTDSKWYSSISGSAMAFARGMQRKVAAGAAAGLSAAGTRQGLIALGARTGIRGGPIGLTAGTVAGAAAPAIIEATTGVGPEMLQHKLEQLISPSFYEMLEKGRQEDYAKNKLAAIAGEVVGGAAAGGFRPSLKEAKATAQGVLQKLFSGKNLDPAIKANLVNNAVGSAIGESIGAIPVVAQAWKTGEPIDWGALLASAAISYPLNTPNVIGRKLGFQPNLPSQISLVNKTAARARKQYDLLSKPAVEQAPVVEKFNAEELARVSAEQEAAIAKAEAAEREKKAKQFYKERDRLNKKLLSQVDNMEKKKAAEELRALDEDAKVFFTKPNEYDDFVSGKYEPELTYKSPAEEAEQVKMPGEDTTDLDVAVQSEVKRPKRIEDIQRLIGELRYWAKQRMRSDLPPDEKQVVDTGYNTVEAKVKKILNYKNLSPEARKTIEDGTRFSQEPPLKMAEPETPPPLPETKKPIPSAFRHLMDWLAPQRHMRIVEEEGLTDKFGNEVAGAAPSEARVEAALNNANEVAVKINPNRAQASDFPHELTHGFRSILKLSKYKTDQKAIAKIDEAIEASPEFQQWKAKRIEQFKGRDPQATVDEYLAEVTGQGTADRILTKNADVELLKDWWSHIKTRFNRGNLKDWQRVIQNKLLYDPPQSYGIKTGGELVGPNGGARFSQEDKQKFEEARRVVDEAKEEPRQFKQTELPLEGDAAKFAMMRRATEGVTDEGKVQGQKEGNQEVARYSQSLSTHSELPPKQKSFRNIPLLEDEVTKLKRRLGGREGEHASRALHLYSQTYTDNLGKYVNGFHDFAKDFSPTEHQHVYDSLARDRLNQSRSDNGLTPMEVELKDKVREALVAIRDDQIKMGLKVEGREAGKDPFWFPGMLAPKVAHEFVTRPHSTESNVAKEKWIKHLVDKGMDIDEARTMVDDYVRALGVEPGKGSYIEFNALRKAEGHGLPKDLADPNMLNALTRYFRRASHDLAYFKTMQNDPIFRRISGIHDADGQLPVEKIKWDDGEEVKTYWNTEGINNAMWWVETGGMPSGALTKHLVGLARLGSSMVVGPITGGRNILTMIGVASPYMSGKDYGAYLESLQKLRQNWQKAFKAGAFRLNPNDIEFGSSANPDVFLKGLDYVSQLIRKYTGGTFVENASRVYSWGIADVITKNQFLKLHENPRDKKALDFIRRFGGTVDNLDSYIGKPLAEIPQEVTSRIAKDLSDVAVQGTYDARGLSREMMDNPLAPALMLSRWSLERSNWVVKDVLTPLRNGDMKPFLKYLFGTSISAAMIAAFNEMVGQNRTVPTISEAVAAENEKEFVGAVMARLQLAAFGGFIGDLLTSGYQLALDRPQYARTIGVPMLNIAYDYGKNIMDWKRTVQQDPDSFVDATLQLADELLLQKIQATRTLANLTWRKEDRERAEKYRDLKTFYELIDRPSRANEMPITGKIKDKTEQFKETGDLDKAFELLPSLIDNALKNSKENPFEFRRQLDSLKANNYITMPNMEEAIDLFVGYYDFLEKTQGPQAAQDRVMDYIQQNLVNQVKKEALP